jgi:hypothetical protein
LEIYSYYIHNRAHDTIFSLNTKLLKKLNERVTRPVQSLEVIKIIGTFESE